MARLSSVCAALLLASICLPTAAQVQESASSAPAKDSKAPADRAPFDPTERYVVKDLLGWRVLVHDSLIEPRGASGEQAKSAKGAERVELGRRVLDQLAAQLYQIEFRLPKPAVEQLRRVRIWVEDDEPHHPCMVYHPDAGWLADHGMNPAKADCVEIANSRKFLRWTIDQPYMTLHELAHAYHDQFLGGHANPEVAAAYAAAKQSGRYDKVLNSSGRTERHYALTNPAEFFAESSEAYFGVNDFYPFVRAELRQHDPDTAELMKRVWQAP